MNGIQLNIEKHTIFHSLIQLTMFEGLKLTMVTTMSNKV